MIVHVPDVLPDWSQGFVRQSDLPPGSDVFILSLAKWDIVDIPQYDCLALKSPANICIYMSKERC
jgi:hypothetical protein